MQRTLPEIVVNLHLDAPEFRPAWWLPSAHLQTVWGRIARPRKLVELRREVVATPDDDDLVLDHLDGAEEQPRVLMLHGLEGSSNSVYMQGILSLLARRRMAATVINFRFCARDSRDVMKPVPNRGMRLYHSGETTDFDFILQLLRRREPHRTFMAFGASLGGNVLLKWLAERRDRAGLARAVTLSVPYDLAAGARYLESGIGKVYVGSFLRSLIRKAELVCARGGERMAHVDLARGRSARSFYEFDDAVTGPLHGFESADEYYEKSSSIRTIDRITTPTLCISAIDDPFLPPGVLHELERRASPAVRLLITEKGGHVGFIEGRHPFAPRYWGEQRVVEWLAAGAGA